MGQIEKSAEVYSRQRSLIEMTAAAQAHVRSFIRGHIEQVLRIDVKQSGCSGYMYVLDVADVPEASDHCCQIADDLVVYITQTALPLVRGLRMDYVTEGLNSTIKFDNPNATAHCGCGESFTTSEPHTEAPDNPK